MFDKNIAWGVLGFIFLLKIEMDKQVANQRSKWWMVVFGGDSYFWRGVGYDGRKY